MTITFQSGQYFDPKIGWLTEKPELKMAENTLPTVAIDDSMAYVIDEQLQKVVDNYKAYSQTLREQRGPAEDPPTVPDDISYSMDKKVYTGNSFTFDGNTMTVNVNLRTSYYLSTSLSLYEEQRSEIMALKDSGYIDEAIDMLLQELDNKFTSHSCKGLSEQLQVLGYDEKTAKDISLKFAKQYLSVRVEGRSIEENMREALLRMGLTNIDIDFGKPGHYGNTGYTGRVLLASSHTDVENYFKHIEMLENWSCKMESEERGAQLVAAKREDGSIELRRRDGKSVEVLSGVERSSTAATE